MACFQAGATIVHLHARRPDEEPEWRRDAYGSVIAELRRRCPGLVLCVSTSGRTYAELDKRADVLALAGDEKPDMASLTLGSLNFRDSASLNAPQTIVALAERMRDARHPPRARGLRHRHGRPRPPAVGPGRARATAVREPAPRGAQHGAATARDLALLADALPADTVWAAAGIGAFQLPMNAIAVFMGGHVRTGLEDSPYLRYDERVPATNVQLVERAVQLAAVAGRRPATVEETRALLGFAPS